MDTNEYLTAPEVARILRASLGCVQRWLLSGRLRGVRRGERGRWLVTRDDLDAFLANPEVKAEVPKRRAGRAEAARERLRRKGYRV